MTFAARALNTLSRGYFCPTTAAESRERKSLTAGQVQLLDQAESFVADKQANWQVTQPSPLDPSRTRLEAKAGEVVIWIERYLPLGAQGKFRYELLAGLDPQSEEKPPLALMNSVIAERLFNAAFRQIIFGDLKLPPR